jgi:hypothetical protein
MSLADFLKRLRTRGPSGERVELKPLEQVLLAYLIEHGSATSAQLQAAIEVRRPVLEQTSSDVASALIAQGLAGMRFDLEGADTRSVFVPTAKGMRLRKALPANPTTVTDFWL